MRDGKLCRCNIWQFIYKKNCKESAKEKVVEKYLDKVAKKLKVKLRAKLNARLKEVSTCRPEVSPPLVDSPTANLEPALNLAPATCQIFNNQKS